LGSSKNFITKIVELGIGDWAIPNPQSPIPIKILKKAKNK